MLLSVEYNVCSGLDRMNETDETDETIASPMINSRHRLLETVPR